MEGQQKNLFARALRPVLQADNIESLGELRYVFQDIDYASFGSLFQRLGDAIPFVDELFTSVGFLVFALIIVNMDTNTQF